MDILEISVELETIVGYLKGITRILYKLDINGDAVDKLSHGRALLEEAAGLIRQNYEKPN